MGLSDNLEAFWKLDEASGSRADSSGNGRTLTDNNTVTQATGKVGNAAQFTAANSEYLSRADEAGLSFGNNVSFSISVWVYGDTWTGAQREIINKNTTEWRLRISNAGRPIFSLPGSTLTHSATLSLATWYHIVAWYDAVADVSGMAINDGTPETTADATGATDGTNELRVGRLGTAYFDGRIDALGIWRRVLTAAEITQLYNSGSGLEHPFGVAYTKELSETLSLSDARQLAIGVTLSEALSTADAGVRSIGYLLSDSMTLSDAAIRATGHALSESLSLTDAMVRAAGKVLAEVLSLEETRTIAIARSVADSLVLQDARAFALARSLSDSLTIDDAVAASILKLMVAYVGQGPALSHLVASELRTTLIASRTRGGE